MENINILHLNDSTQIPTFVTVVTINMPHSPVNLASWCRPQVLVVDLSRCMSVQEVQSDGATCWSDEALHANRMLTVLTLGLHDNIYTFQPS